MSPRISVLIATLMIIGLAFAVWTREAHVQPAGNLYSFCDAERKDACNPHALMLKDVCEATVRSYTDGSDRFSCGLVDAATRDAYLRTLDWRVFKETLRAWREGR
jgi:hypothetical protein